MKLHSNIVRAIILVLVLMLAACSGSNSPSSEGKKLGAAVLDQPPMITGFSPGWQSEGAAITIAGANFDPVAANNTVKFNGAPAKIASATATSLMVIVPVGATPGPISVTTAKGTAASTVDFVVLGGADAPVITGFSPASGSVGTEVTISGTNFNANPDYNRVTFNGTRATVTAATATSLTVTVPDGTSGNISVSTPGGGGKVSSNSFMITFPDGPAPVIKRFTPLRGAVGNTVQIFGRNLSGSTVYFTGTWTSAAIVSSASDGSSVVVSVPSGTLPGPISLTNSAGFTRSATNFNLAVTPDSRLKGGAIQPGSGLASNLLGSAVTFAGGGDINSLQDATGTDARFSNPNGITTDGDNLYIADSGFNVIRKIVLSGADAGKVTTLAGSGAPGSQNGTGVAASFSSPTGITTDGTSLYVADLGSNKIRKIAPPSGVALSAMTKENAIVTTFAGSGSVITKDGTGTLAAIRSPYGITTDNVNLYVTDGSNRIRKIIINTQEVKTYAGSGDYSSIDGVVMPPDGTPPSGALATFFKPHGIAISPDFTRLYVADTSSSVIREIDQTTGVVTTIGGSPGVFSSVDGSRNSGRFNSPYGVTTDGANLFVADTGNHVLRKIVLADKSVSTLAGSAGNYGAVDGALADATFKLPAGIISVGSDIFVSDTGNNEIRKISGQTVTTFAGKINAPAGTTNGTGTDATFNFPYGITTDGAYLYVTDAGAKRIRRISLATRKVDTVAGDGVYSGSVDAVGKSAIFNFPAGITTDGVSLYVADAGSHKIRQVDIATGFVTTLAGTGGYGSKDSDSSDITATFSQPFGITTDGMFVYVADSGSNKIRRIDVNTGQVTTVAGSGSVGSTDSPDAASATFNLPSGITVSGDYLYVADTGNNKVRVIQLSTGSVNTLAGTGLYWGNDIYNTVIVPLQWNGLEASFRHPIGMTTDGTYLYIADTENNMIMKYEIGTGKVSPLVGSGVFGSTDGNVTEASFSQPVGITTDGTALYTTEYLNNLVRKIQ